MAELERTGLVASDTDLVIDFLRGRGPGTSLVREWLQRQQLRLTAVTAFELRLGATYPSKAASIQALFHNRSVPLDVVAGFTAGKIYQDLKRRNLAIGLRDCLQGGICIRYEIPLATRNVEHFKRISGLQLIEVS